MRVWPAGIALWLPVPPPQMHELPARTRSAMLVQAGTDPEEEDTIVTIKYILGICYLQSILFKNTE